MSDNQEIQEQNGAVKETPVSQAPQSEKKLGLKSWFLIAIASVAILAFVADTGVKVYRGESVNTELLQNVLETLFKLVSSSDDA